MDAARSGINQQVNLTAEMATEIKVCHETCGFHFCFFPSSPSQFNVKSLFSPQTASGNPDKEKTTHWKPNIREKAD